MPSKVATVNFGASNASLSTVGYRILNPDLTTFLTRTTTGVTEVITASGIYRVTLSYPPNFNGIIMWDTGEATPQYAGESINPIDADSVAGEVRTMLRSLNTSLSSHLERLFGDRLGKKKWDNEFEDFSAKIEELKKSLSVVGIAVSKIDFSPTVNVNTAMMDNEIKKQSAFIANQMKSLESEISKAVRKVESIEFSPQINVDLARIESVVLKLSEISRQHTESLEKSLRALNAGIDIRSGKLSEDIRNLMIQISNDLKSIGSTNDGMMAKKLNEFSNKASISIQAMQENMQKSIELLVQKMTDKIKADLLLEMIKNAVKENSKIPIDSDTRKLLMGLYR